MSPETRISGHWLHLLVTMLVLVIAFAFVNVYWIAEFWLAPDSAMSIHNLYQTDEDYYPLTYNLSRGNWSEFSVLESRGCCVFPFPIASLAIHAVLLRVVGDYGWLIADLVVTAGAIALLFSGFRLITGDAYFGALNTLLLVAYSSGPNLLESISHRLFLGDIEQFYSYRYPRPLVTTVFLLIQLSTLVWAMRAASLRQLLFRAATVGVSCSILLEGDLHGGVTAFITATGVLVWCVFRLKGSGSGLLKMSAAYAGASGLVLLPFLYQVSHASPELKRRWGTIPIARWSPLLLPHTARLLLFAVGALLVLCGLTAWREKLNSRTKNACFSTPLAVVLASYTVSIFALPASSALMGEGIQISQFLDRTLKLQTLLVMSLISALICFACSRWPGPYEKRLLPDRWTIKAKLGALLLVLIMPSAYYHAHGLRGLSSTAHVRNYEGWPPVPGYRSQFEELAQFLLLRYDRGPVRVLATFDHQVRMWWQGKMNQPVYLPDPFESVVPDAEIERRLVSLTRLLDFSQQDLEKALDNFYFNLRFLGCMKYQVSATYHLAQLSDYEPEQLETTRRGDFRIAIPRTVSVRLTQEAREAALVGQLDVIVLNKSIRWAEYHVPQRVFVRVFENAEFEVWQAR